MYNVTLFFFRNFPLLSIPSFPLSLSFPQAGGGGGALKRPKPAGAPWLSEVSWSKILELDKLGEPEGKEEGIPLFKNWSDRFEKNIAAWGTVFEADVPQEAEWPEGLNSDRFGDDDDTSTIEQALILLAFRPDGMVISLQDVIMGKLGPEFLGKWTVLEGN